MTTMNATNGIDLTGVTWRKASYSAGNNECVEIADGFARTRGVIAVRDSKNPGAALIFPTAAFTGFIAEAKTGRFGHNA